MAKDPIKEAMRGRDLPGNRADALASAVGKRAQQRPFVHLRCHSAFSLLEGALPLAKIIGFAKRDRMPAIAVTDTNNLFGALEFAEKCRKDGVQPIIGCQLDFAVSSLPGLADHGAKSGSSGQGAGATAANARLETAPLLLIAATASGYANLVHLVSRAWLETPGGEPVHARGDWLTDSADGIICLTGGPSGPLARMLATGHEAAASDLLAGLQSVFADRLYVELQRYRGHDRALEAATINLAYARELPLVATNDCFFETAADHEAHDALLAIAEGSVVAEDNRRRVTPDHHLRPASEMLALFADLPEAIDNSVEIAMRVSTWPKTLDPILPRFTGGDSADPVAALKAEADELRRQAHDGLTNRIATIGMTSGHDEQEYRARLDFELGTIETMKFPGYFLIVADFIKWAKSKGIPVGPGRGSGAGSLVAWSLTITDVDPLRFSLLFERFLNPDRVSMPDFDIDFCQERRDEVIRYVQERYGRDQVAQIITFGTLQARAVLRDVGRVLQMPYGQVDRLTKMVPANPANPVTLKQAIEDEPKLREEAEREPVVARLLEMAQKLEGLYRHASTHAAGIVIGDRPLADLVPLYRDPRSDMPVTQFNMKWVEPAGLVKFDFLGLKTLTVLQRAVDLVARHHGKTIDLATLPLDDKPTYDMLSQGAVTGVFQVESAGMRKALLGMKPDRIEDIIALVALYRPGPMENIPTYNARKHGEEELASIHPKIDHLVAETQGVIVYQEQVMQIAQELAGYTLGQADLLRRAMGKKIRAEMEKQRSIFVDGATARGVSKQQSDFIFDLLAKFADYGFNKSHAAAYAIVSYQTAYMKAHWPVEFIAASMSYDMANTDKLNDFRRDAQRLGIEVVPPSVQTSFRLFEVGENRIFYALCAIKGIGEGAVEHIVALRDQKPFASLEDFCTRIDPRLIGKRVLESLVNAGALDCFGHDRARLFAGIERMMGLASRMAAEASSGQSDMFGAASGAAPEKLVLPDIEAWTPSEKLQREFSAAGFYLSAHPLDEYADVLKRMRVQSFAEFSVAVKAGATAGRLAGTVVSKQERRTRTGNKMGIVNLSDASGQFECVLFSEVLAQYRDQIEPGRSLVITVGAEDRPEGINLRVQTLTPLEEEAARAVNNLRIYLRDAEPLKHLRTQLSAKGEGGVSLVMIQGQGRREIEIALPGSYRTDSGTARALKGVAGVVDVEVV
jgi:DNA polymerase-3 subunit alpha